MRITRLALLSFLVSPVSGTLCRADAGSTPGPLGSVLSSPPTVTTVVGFAAKEMYDSNVYLQSVTAEANHGSWVSDVTPSVSVSLRPGGTAKLALGYVADINIYHSATEESYTRHTGTVDFSQTDGDWTDAFSAGVVDVDGSNISPTYTGPGGSPAIGGPERMGRRDQDIYTACGSVAYTHDQLLLRPVASWRDQVFHALQSPAAGYQNLVNRREDVAGLDVGWQATSTLTPFVSVRLGRQEEDDLFGEVNDYTNNITRYLVGLEGSAGSHLKLNLLLGEDQRTFTQAALAFPGGKKDVFYSNSNAVWSPTSTDTVTFSYVRFLQPAFGGRNVYEDLTAEVKYRRVFGPLLSGGVGYKIYDGFFEIGSRRDSIYSPSATLALTLSSRSTLSLDYQYATTMTGTLGAVDTAGRDYRRNQYSLSYKGTF